MSSRPGRGSVEEAEAEAARNFATHTARPGDVRSFYLQRSSGDRNHSCHLTWTPGCLVLSGDAGDVTLTHHGTMGDFEPSLGWVERSSAQYLVGKSNLPETVLDRRATAEYLIEAANGEAGQSLKVFREEYQRNRREEALAPRQYLVDVLRWRALPVGELPLLDDYGPEPDWRENKPTFRYRMRNEYSPDQLWIAPDGWDLWHRLHARFGYDFSAEDVLKAKGRMGIREQLYSEIEDMSPDHVVELCNELGHDDYYGCYVTSPDSAYQVAMVQQACRVVLDSLHPRRTWGSTWGDPVV